MMIPNDATRVDAPGWLAGIGHCPSPNFNARPADACIDLIVVHSISLPPGQYGGPEVFELFANRLDWAAHPYFQQIEGLEVSAHFFIRRDGSVWQFVSTLERAWHAGRSCWRGRSECNDDGIGIELEGLEGEPFEPAQYTALAELCQRLKTLHPIAHIAGHEHIAPGRKADPGAGFDWPHLQTLLHWPVEAFPPNTSSTRPLSA